MTRNKIQLVAFLLVCLNLLANNSNAQCGFIQADNFNNIWVVNRSEVICFNKQLAKVGSYSNLFLGNPEYIDALDPFRVIVFYKNSQSITILNNSVSEISNPISLKEKGINDASLVCRSGKGGFWIFNRIDWAILHFDSDFLPTGEKIIPETRYSESTPLFMQEYNGKLYLSFSNQDISVYDRYGAVCGIVPIKTNSLFSICNGSIFYLSDGNLLEYNLETKIKKSLGTDFYCPPIVVNDSFLYFDGSGLAVHKIR
jgi:hypothetical protein